MYNINNKDYYYYIPSLSFKNPNIQITNEMKINLYNSIFKCKSREIISFDCQQSIKPVMNYINEFEGLRDVKIGNWMLNSENETINMRIEDICLKYLNNKISNIIYNDNIYK